MKEKFNKHGIPIKCDNCISSQGFQCQWGAKLNQKGCDFIATDYALEARIEELQSQLKSLKKMDSDLTTLYMCGRYDGQKDIQLSKQGNEGGK